MISTYRQLIDKKNMSKYTAGCMMQQRFLWYYTRLALHISTLFAVLGLLRCFVLEME
jgi:hypothetical protein